MAGGSKNKLEYVKQDAPKFLRDFKARVGYKEGPTVETKKQTNLKRDPEDDDVEREDEKPTICVLKDGDISAEEYAKYEQLHQKKICDKIVNTEDDETTPADGKIMFKKPLKRKNEHENALNAKKEPKHKGKKKKTSKACSNKTLLSFADNEED